MNQKAVINAIKSTALSLSDAMQFGTGRASDFNVIKDKNYPYIWLDPVNASASLSNNNSSNYQKTYNVQMVFYALDSADSIEDEYTQILNDTSDLVDQFINKLNLLYESLTITNISIQPFIKTTSDILTGHILTFNVVVPDSFDYCAVHDC